MIPARVPCLVVLLAGCVGMAQAQQGDGTRASVQANVFKPAKAAASAERIAALKAPEGFRVTVFASGLKNARMLAVAPDGTVYLSRREQGDVLMLRDANGDGRADAAPVTVANRPGAHGLAIHDGRLYIATVKEIFVASLQPDGRLGPLSMLLGDLPDAGQHANRTIAFGPDDMLYISVGSTCNACNESNPENATLLRASTDGKSRTIFASGLRNTIGFGWSPTTGELWGMDHGIDDLGDTLQPEELNRIERGKQYGWPHVWGEGGITPQTNPPGDITKEAWKSMSTPMVLGYTAHAAPMQMAFYTGTSFPAEFAGDAFVAMRGSWNRAQASGYEVVRVRFSHGQPQSIEPFVTGFLTDSGQTHIARPAGLAVARDGALLMADDANGIVYRIAYSGSARTASAAQALPPRGQMQQQATRGVGVPLALEREEVRSPSAASASNILSVSSPSIADGASIPQKHSEYFDGVSPELKWSSVPGAKSYVLIMEDPDAKPITPFVHWVAWNIPASVTSLPEGLQEAARLTEPEGLHQGKTSRGTVGYLGPRPPAGDPAHRYHFQVLALDTWLNLAPGSDRDAVLAAVRGHVLAKGRLVGQYRQATPPPK